MTVTGRPPQVGKLLDRYIENQEVRGLYVIVGDVLPMKLRRRNGEVMNDSRNPRDPRGVSETLCI